MATVAGAIVSAVGALVWHSTRLGWLDAWALTVFRADTLPEFQLASALSASLRLLGLGVALGLAAFAWFGLRRADAVALAMGSPPATVVVEKLLKQLVARRIPGAGMFGYPSGHLAVAAGLAITLVLVVRLARPRPGVMALIAGGASLLVLVLARARLAETAHSLSDVVGGIATGVAVTLGVALLLDGRVRGFAKPGGGASTGPVNG